MRRFWWILLLVADVALASCPTTADLKYEVKGNSMYITPQPTDRGLKYGSWRSASLTIFWAEQEATVKNYIHLASFVRIEASDTQTCGDKTFLWTRLRFSPSGVQQLRASAISGTRLNILSWGGMGLIQALGDTCSGYDFRSVSLAVTGTGNCDWISQNFKTTFSGAVQPQQVATVGPIGCPPPANRKIGRLFWISAKTYVNNTTGEVWFEFGDHLVGAWSDPVDQYTQCPSSCPVPIDHTTMITSDPFGSHLDDPSNECIGYPGCPPAHLVFLVVWKATNLTNPNPNPFCTAGYWITDLSAAQNGSFTYQFKWDFPPHMRQMGAVAPGNNVAVAPCYPSQEIGADDVLSAQFEAWRRNPQGKFVMYLGRFAVTQGQHATLRRWDADPTHLQVSPSQPLFGGNGGIYNAQGAPFNMATTPCTTGLRLGNNQYTTPIYPYVWALFNEWVNFNPNASPENNPYDTVFHVGYPTIVTSTPSNCKNCEIESP